MGKKIRRKNYMVHHIFKIIVCFCVGTFFMISESYSMRPLVCALVRVPGKLACAASAPAVCGGSGGKRQAPGIAVLSRTLSGLSVNDGKSLECPERIVEQKTPKSVLVTEHAVASDTKQEDKKSSTVKKGSGELGAIFGTLFAGASIVWAASKYRDQELRQIAFDCIVSLEYGKIQENETDVIIHDGRKHDGKKKRVIKRANFFEAIVRYIMSDSVCTNNLSLAFAQYIKIRRHMPSKTLLFLLLTSGSHQVKIINALVKSGQIGSFPIQEFIDFYEENFEKPRIDTCEGTIRSMHDRTIADQLIAQAGLLENVFTQGMETLVGEIYKDQLRSDRRADFRSIKELTKIFADKKSGHTLKFRYTREDYKTIREKYEADRLSRRAAVRT